MRFSYNKPTNTIAVPKTLYLQKAPAMSLAVVHSRALNGLNAPSVTVEVHLANGLPNFTLVGLADTEVKEARERVRAAIANSGLAFPHNKRITVNLAPADLPKETGRFDLPIAIGILAASGQIDAAHLERYEFAGELSLAGDLRPVRGALAMGLALYRADNSAKPRRSLVLPYESASEAALVEGLPIHSARHLMDVVRALLPSDAEHTAMREPLPLAKPLQCETRDVLSDLREVKGQSAAKRALEIAAAGGHSVLMVGPPGTGKSMLAHRFAGLLPVMPYEQALESAAVLSLHGSFSAKRWKLRVVRQPHHGASAVALVGGGSPPRPGEISLAHHGVLFLDELAEFPRSALEALREPMETGRITISRAARQAEFPASFQLIAAMNPCPCGHLGSPLRSCRCAPDMVLRYQGRISGPMLDRIDMQVEVPAVSPQTMATLPDGEPTSAIAERVAMARETSQARQGCANAQLNGSGIDEQCALAEDAAKFLHAAAARLGWSARSYHRVLRVARTVADLQGSAAINVPHLAEAIQYRRVLAAR